MDDEELLLQEQSKLLFGQKHRLALMVAIAESAGMVNPTELAVQLKLAQSAFQAPLKDLEGAGLLTRSTDGRRTIYRREESTFWAAAVEARDLVREEVRRQRVRTIG